MESFVHHYELNALDGLLKEKESEFYQFLNSLSVDHVRENGDYFSITQNVKKNILLTPVSFGTPKIINNAPAINWIPPSYEGYSPRESDQVITIAFPFTGSSELFHYMPTNTNMPLNNNMMFFQPTSASEVTVDIILPILDKIKALNEAQKKMESTISLINHANIKIREWVDRNEATFLELLNNKRKELVDFYS